MEQSNNKIESDKIINNIKTMETVTIVLIFITVIFIVIGILAYADFFDTERSKSEHLFFSIFSILSFLALVIGLVVLGTKIYNSTHFIYEFTDIPDDIKKKLIKSSQRLRVQVTDDSQGQNNWFTVEDQKRDKYNEFKQNDFNYAKDKFEETVTNNSPSIN